MSLQDHAQTREIIKKSFPMTIYEMNGTKHVAETYDGYYQLAQAQGWFGHKVNYKDPNVHPFGIHEQIDEPIINDLHTYNDGEIAYFPATTPVFFPKDYDAEEYAEGVLFDEVYQRGCNTWFMLPYYGTRFTREEALKEYLYEKAEADAWANREWTDSDDED